MTKPQNDLASWSRSRYLLFFTPSAWHTLTTFAVRWRHRGNCARFSRRSFCFGYRLLNNRKRTMITTTCIKTCRTVHVTYRMACSRVPARRSNNIIYFRRTRFSIGNRYFHTQRDLEMVDRFFVCRGDIRHRWNRDLFGPVTFESLVKLRHLENVLMEPYGFILHL